MHDPTQNNLSAMYDPLLGCVHACTHIDTRMQTHACKHNACTKHACTHLSSQDVCLSHAMPGMTQDFDGFDPVQKRLTDQLQRNDFCACESKVCAFELRVCACKASVCAYGVINSHAFRVIPPIVCLYHSRCSCTQPQVYNMRRRRKYWGNTG